MDYPKILQLDITGFPFLWITYETAATLHAKGRIAWTMGSNGYRIHGGVQKISGIQSVMDLDTIMAIRDEKTNGDKSYLFKTPRPTASLLFKRDRNVCAYCGNQFNSQELTRDHITPQSRGGESSWMNLVAACKSCNHRKSDNTPDEADMKLLYVPYVPCRAEWLILQNKNILADQMNFLLTQVPKNSRVFLKD